MVENYRGLLSVKVSVIIAKGHACYTRVLKNQKKRLKSPVFSPNAMKYQLP